MGLHTGEPLIASTGYVGMDVHRAARIGDAGHGGQVLLSQTTRDLVMQELPEGMTIRDLGEHRLKDMKYPTPIYQLVMEGSQTNFPPLKTKFTGAEAPAPARHARAAARLLRSAAPATGQATRRRPQTAG